MTTTDQNTHRNGNAEASCSSCSCSSEPCSDSSLDSHSQLEGGKSFRIANMDCASEEAEIRHALEAIDGIQSLRFNLAERVIAITATEASLPKH